MSITTLSLVIAVNIMHLLINC